ncbi:uncharacterized protein [Zea mays]|uniref:uncharacterized protein n=1 Tax=Zea mays TaxID=4577 RepID=UPI001651C511|nr:uncharacterized protein LOC103630989 [Zea mays]
MVHYICVAVACVSRGGSLRRQRLAHQPWNLRTVAPTRQAGSDDATEAAERAPAPTPEVKKQASSVALSKQEIADDFTAIRGTRPPRWPKKRPRMVQQQLDLLYLGLWLADVAPGSYKIEEETIIVKALKLNDVEEGC